VNPALFPNTVINSPASHISINYNIQGFNATVSTGFCASLDAFHYAVNMMSLYDYEAVLAGGVEDLNEQAYKGFCKIGGLAGSRDGKDEVNCPFDRRRNGIMLGEGSSVFVLETLERARRRNARIYAEVLGYGTAFDARSRNMYSTAAHGATAAMKGCLKDGRTDAREIDYISSSANSTLDCDVMETNAVRNVFGHGAKDVPVSSVKSMIGECFSASGAMNLAASIGALAEGFVPPTINYTQPDRRCGLDYVPNESRPKRVRKVLINAFSPTGPNSAMLIGMCKA
jgi:3-oxoacyl-[acyl-carrier-protein] synthase II